jgi:hypothetical protein
MVLLTYFMSYYIIKFVENFATLNNQQRIADWRQIGRLEGSNPQSRDPIFYNLPKKSICVTCYIFFLFFYTVLTIAAEVIYN